jgi:hypothetical protein
MSVLLEAIEFNHDPNSATADALNIRRNATEFVTVPEWQRGISVNPEDSPAAYALKETQGHTITIRAKFSRTDPEIQTIEVRAVDPEIDPPMRDGCAGLIWWFIRILLRWIYGNVLGEVKAKQVSFLATGQTNFETFELQNVRLWNVGVGVHTTTWRWQYRRQSNDPWTDFATSEHRIYTVLETPTSPWQQAPYHSGNTQLPWAEVLDYVCRWALVAPDVDSAAARITRSVYDLGSAIVEYDCPGGGGTRYAAPAFNCTAFLERLRGGIGNGLYVNCTDCATIVSVFANILGCDLWQSRMGWSFDLNPILAIGFNVWYPGCQNWSGTGFYYHEVAWKGACTENEEVFDACLQVDGDADPTTAPHTPMLPVNLRFGNVGDGLYRDRLATPAGRPNCAPQTSTRQRRTII